MIKAERKKFIKNTFGGTRLWPAIKNIFAEIERVKRLQIETLEILDSMLSKK
jgi:hypothetical protein